MTKGKKKMLIGTGCIAGGAAIIGSVSYVVTKRLAKFALERYVAEGENANSQKREEIKKNEEFQRYRKEMSRRLQEKEAEEIRMVSHDGIRLAAHWCPHENAKRVIIAMHGWRSSWSRDFGMFDEFWHNNNCSVLYVEQRAQNESDGEYMSFGILERYDCLEWIKWANKRTEEKLPIYLHGISMGAATVLMTTGFELPENVCGVIADCGFTSVPAIWKHVVKNRLHIPYSSLAANRTYKKRIHVGTKEYSTKDALSSNKIPVLFIHGEEDDFVPTRMSYENYECCVAPKQLYVVPGAGHAMSYYMDCSGYEQVVKDFWEAYYKSKNDQLT